LSEQNSELSSGFEKKKKKKKKKMFRATFTPEGEKMEYFRLMTGHLIPAIGLGTWKSGPQARYSVETAIVEVLFKQLFLVSSSEAHPGRYNARSILKVIVVVIFSKARGIPVKCRNYSRNCCCYRTYLRKFTLKLAI